MTEISFKLIRAKNPHLDVENIEKCPAINLNGLNIDRIDNLELFTHIIELNLSNNGLTKIENLSLFHNLQYLDVSHNFIDAIGLKASFSSIPKTLNTINLSGNPCAEDDIWLGILQDTFPNINIVVDVLNAEEIQAEKEQILHSDVIDTTVYDYSTIAAIPDEPLNSDSVLKYIVDRKCKLQSLAPTFDLDCAVKELNEEYSKAIEVRDSSINSRIKAHGSSQEQVDATVRRIKERTEELLERNSAERAKFGEFMARLKQTAAQHKILSSVAKVEDK